VKTLAIVVLLVVAGCRRQVVVSSPPAATPTTPAAGVNAPGGANQREALQKFMAAAKVKDIQAFASVWGSKDGPARDLKLMTQTDLEQRAIFLMICLKHDSYSVLGETPAVGGERVMAVEVKYQDLTRQSNFTAVQGPSQRWYIRAFEVDPLQMICVRR
jgi:hypothetical protein